MKTLLYIFSFLALIGCKTVSSLEKSVSEKKDSVSYKERLVIKDSLIYTKVDSAAIKALVVCPDGKPLDIKPTIAKHNQATAVFEIKNGVASVKCICDSVGIVARHRDRIITEFKSHLNSEESVKETVKEVPYYPMWLKILAGIGVASALYWIYKLIRIFY